MAAKEKFPGFELSGDFLTINARDLPVALKIATWAANEYDADKTPTSRFVWLGSGVRTHLLASYVCMGCSLDVSE